MRSASLTILLVITTLGCADDPDVDPAPTAGNSSTTAADGSTSADPAETAASEDGPSPTSGPQTSGSTETTSPDPSTGSSGEPAPEVPGGVFLWTGSGGGGPGTDLYPDAVVSTLVDAGVDAELGDALPADFEGRFGTLVYLNPTDDFDPGVDAAAQTLVEGGGRLVLVMEHCKNGCWGNADGHNALLASLGSSLQMVGDGGAPLSDTSLNVTPALPVTDGVAELVVYYSGRVELGNTGTALGQIDGGDTVIGYEALGWGEVIAIADSSILGYRLDAGDNARFVRNWGTHAAE